MTTQAVLTFYDAERRVAGTVTVENTTVPHVFPLGAGIASVSVTLPPGLPPDVRAFLADVSEGRTVARAEAEAELWHGSADTDNERMADLALQAARLLEKYGGSA